jgi:glycosyltransferase involved in cell wall biosynthesis
MENGVVNLANHLPPEKIQSQIICLEHAGAFAQRLQPRTVVTALGRRPGWDWRACWRLAAAWNRQPPEVIHTHNLGPLIYTVVARMLVPSLWRVPILHGEHGALQGDSLSPRRLRQRKLLYRLCRKVHTVSEGLRRELIALGFPAQKIITLLNGVDCERFVPAADVTNVRQAIGLPENAWVIGSVGRFIATKRYPLLIQAFEKLAAHHPQLLLVILGDGGPEKTNIAEMISKSPFNSRILALGHQPDPAPFYQAMDLMVMPSSHEGLANALLEAMACGVPVLAHAACGATEVIEDGVNGILCHIQEAGDLAVAIDHLINHPHHLTSMGQSARASAVENFSLRSMMANYVTVYQACAGKHCETQQPKMPAIV